MDDNENKKSNEELADEALDKVAGGKICSDRSGMYYCSNCGATFPIIPNMRLRHIKCPSCGAE